MNALTKRGFKERPSKPFNFQEFKNNWLMDRGAYPVMFIIGFAVCFCTTVGTRCLLTNPDVRIDRAKRQSVLRYWGPGFNS